MSSKDQKFAKKNRPVQTIKSKASRRRLTEPSEPVYNIEKILDIKTQKGKKLCRIKWQGWDEEKDITWEPFQNIPQEAIDQYYQQKKGQENPNKKASNQDEQNQSGSSEQIKLKTKQGRQRARKILEKQEKQQKEKVDKVEKVEKGNTNQAKKNVIENSPKQKEIQKKSDSKPQSLFGLPPNQQSLFFPHQNSRPQSLFGLPPNQQSLFFPRQHSQQGKKGLKTSMMGSIPRRPKIVIPKDDSSLSHIEESQSQHYQSHDKQSQFNDGQSSSNAQGSLFSQSSNQQAKSPRKLRHLRGNQHVTLQKRLRQRSSNQKTKPKRGKKKRKLNEFSDDQEQGQTIGRRPIVIGQTKIKYPTHLQTAEQYPDHQLYSTRKADSDYQKYVRGYIDHINSSGQFSEGDVSIGDISDSSHEQGDSYHTERSERGIPQNTLKRIITKLNDQNKNQIFYQVQTFDSSLLVIKQHFIKTYFPRLLVQFQQKIIQDLQQVLKNKDQKEDKQEGNKQEGNKEGNKQESKPQQKGKIVKTKETRI